MEYASRLATARKIMLEFSERTSLRGTGQPRRYLWTDAFALCNYLALYHMTKDDEYKALSVELIDQVHLVLGRHRDDDSRTGWISGMEEEEGGKHPTAGGLRIGKKLKERGPEEPRNDRLEWERDGQYFHYLTKWMQALNQAGCILDKGEYVRWAKELALAAHKGFVHEVSLGGNKIMYWKMSIDLTYPLVPAMGQHDPLDGLVSAYQLSASAGEMEGTLEPLIRDYDSMISPDSLATDDPLGIGGLLCHGHALLQLLLKGKFHDAELILLTLNASLEGIQALQRRYSLSYPAEYRLAFRELGLSIGLKALERTKEELNASREKIPRNQDLQSVITSLQSFTEMAETIEKFWLDSANQQAGTWLSHEDINAVMLATSLVPEGYLQIKDWQ